MKPTVLCIGLGNPGASYRNTRHNVGFMAVDRLAEGWGSAEWKPKAKFRAEICEGTIRTLPALFVKPDTYMNASGESVVRILNFYQMDPSSVLVFCDDVDLPYGSTRFRTHGGPGTHNGLRSMVDSIGDQFARCRVGIAPKSPVKDLANWVLSRFSEDELTTIHPLLTALPQQVQHFLDSGENITFELGS